MADMTTGAAEAAGLAGLSISAETTGALGTTLGLIQQLKAALYDIAQNPLLAPMAAIKLQNELGKITLKIKDFTKEVKGANTTMGLLSATLKEPSTWVRLGAFVMATGLKFQQLRTEIAQTTLSFYAATSAAGDKGFALGLQTTRNALDTQRKYGKEAADKYVEIYRSMYARLEDERKRGGQSYGGRIITPLSDEQTLHLSQNMAILTKATGVDYKKASDVLIESFAQVGVGQVEAVVGTWLASSTNK